MSLSNSGGSGDQTPETRYTKSSTKSSKSSVRSIPEASQKIEEKIGILKREIKGLQSKNKSYAEKEKELDVLEHMKQIKDVQKEYLVSIKKDDKRDYLLEKLVEMDDKVDNYSQKYLDGSMNYEKFVLKASSTLEKLKEFLSTLERHISVEATAKKIIGKRTRADGRPLIRGIEVPPLAIPAVTRRRFVKRSKSSSSDEKPRISSKKSDKSGTYDLSKQLLDKQFKVVNKYTGVPQKKRIGVGSPGVGLVKPVRDIDVMPDKDVLKMVKDLGLKFPVIKDPKIRKRGVIINKKDKAKVARRLLKEYYKNQKPGRQLVIKRPEDVLPKVLSKKEIEKIGTQPAKKLAIPALPRRKVKVQKRKQVKTQKKPPPQITDEIFDPFNLKHNQVVKVKGKGMITKIRSPPTPLGIPSQQTGEVPKVQYDPRESWLWSPTEEKYKKDYEKMKKSLLRAISRASVGNQMYLTHVIDYSHRELQKARFQIGQKEMTRGKGVVGKKPLVLSVKAKELIDKITSKRIDRVPVSKKIAEVSQKDLYVPVEGQIRPGGKVPQSRVIKVVPKEVLNYDIPSHYQRIEVLKIPKYIETKQEHFLDSTGKAVAPGRVVEAKKQEIVRITPNWNDVKATGETWKDGNTLYKKVTVQDLEKYLAETYLRKDAETSPVRISVEDRAYAYQHAVDFRKLKGIIDKEAIDKARGSDSPSKSGSSQTKLLRELNNIFVEIRRVGNLKTEDKYVKKGKKTVKAADVIMTEEQRKKVLEGKITVPGAPMVEYLQTAKAELQKLRTQFEAKGAKLKDAKSKAQFARWKENIKKIFSNINQGQFKKELPKLKRGGGGTEKKAPRAAAFMRVQKSKKSSSSSSSSSPSSSSKTKSSPSSKSSKSSRKSSSSSSSMLDFAAEIEKEMAGSPKKAKSPAKSPAKGGGKKEETIKEFIDRLERERELKKKGITVPSSKSKQKKVTDVSKPLQKAYPGVTMEDLFGEDYEEIPSPPSRN
jgi:hypothetical protein